MELFSLQVSFIVQVIVMQFVYVLIKQEGEVPVGLLLLALRHARFLALIATCPHTELSLCPLQLAAFSAVCSKAPHLLQEVYHFPDCSNADLDFSNNSQSYFKIAVESMTLC